MSTTVYISKETATQTEARLKALLPKVAFQWLDSPHQYDTQMQPLAQNQALAQLVTPSGALEALQPCDATQSDALAIALLTFPSGHDNSGFVGWFASQLKKATGSGLVVISGAHHDYFGFPWQAKDAIQAWLNDFSQQKTCSGNSLEAHLTPLGQFGPYQADVINFGNFALDGGAMFGTVPKVLWQRVTDCDCDNRVPNATNCLLLRDGTHTVLIDTGNGDKWTPKQRQMYAIAPAPPLESLLAQAGTSPEKITHVLLTHLHFDHVGGCTRYKNDAIKNDARAFNAGDYEPVFKNAQIWVHEGEWQYAIKPHARSKASYLPQNLWPIQSQLKFCTEATTQVLPGLRMQVTGGHTTYHQVVILEANNPDTGHEGLIFWGDILPTHNHVKTAWVMGYDERPIETMAVKDALLAQAHQKRWLSLLGHDTVSAVLDAEAGFVKTGVTA
ncbi:MAG: DUF6196 family protein [Vampirovibrionales bacterium]|nr:DUF6196 family protein [Vampirovibrionales bacterium]